MNVDSYFYLKCLHSDLSQTYQVYNISLSTKFAFLDSICYRNLLSLIIQGVSVLLEDFLEQKAQYYIATITIKIEWCMKVIISSWPNMKLSSISQHVNKQLIDMLYAHGIQLIIKKGNLRERLTFLHFGISLSLLFVLCQCKIFQMVLMSDSHLPKKMRYLLH